MFSLPREAENAEDAMTESTDTMDHGEHAAGSVALLHRYAARVAETCWPESLPDGRTVWIGPLLPTDAPTLAAEYQTLSETSQRHRFLGAISELTPAMLHHLVDEVDGVEHVALVAFVEEDDDLVPVGIGRIVRYPGVPDAADIAVTVKDAWQGQGIGTVLCRKLIERRPPGVDHLLTEVAFDNRAPLAILHQLGQVHAHPTGDGAYDVEVDLFGVGARYAAPEAGSRLHPVLDSPERRRLRSRDEVCRDDRAGN